MILVTGATGTTGREVVAHLARQNVRFRAMVHDPQKAGSIRLPGVEIVQGDFADAQSVAAALDGIDRVFLVSRPSPDQVRLESTVIDACRRAGVQQLVKGSIFGADPQHEIPYLRWNGQIEQHLAQSGLAPTVLRPNLFMQYLVEIAPQVATDGVLSYPVREGRISMIDARDIGEVAAICLTQEGHQGKTYTITGPEALSLQEVADLLSSVLGRRVNYVSPPPEQAREYMTSMGMPDWEVEASLAFAEYYARDEAASVTPDVRELTGHPARSFRQFAQDYAQVFLQAGEMRKAA